MFELYAGGPFAVDPTDPRNQFHERALFEARIAHEYRTHRASLAEHVDVVESRPNRLVSRFRFALAGGPSIAAQSCECPA
jgi:hypothetical protein